MSTDRVALTLRLDAEDHQALRRVSYERRIPVNEIIRRTIHGMLSSPGELNFLLDPDPED